jgi:hypothetical protein
VAVGEGLGVRHVEGSAKQAVLLVVERGKEVL